MILSLPPSTVFRFRVPCEEASARLERLEPHLRAAGHLFRGHRRHRPDADFQPHALGAVRAVSGYRGYFWLCAIAFICTGAFHIACDGDRYSVAGAGQHFGHGCVGRPHHQGRIQAAVPFLSNGKPCS